MAIFQNNSSRFCYCISCYATSWREHIIVQSLDIFSGAQALTSIGMPTLQNGNVCGYSHFFGSLNRHDLLLSAHTVVTMHDHLAQALVISDSERAQSAYLKVVFIDIAAV
jgi:hypothetical protein